jgi:hypothetical protein
MYVTYHRINFGFYRNEKERKLRVELHGIELQIWISDPGLSFSFPDIGKYFQLPTVHDLPVHEEFTDFPECERFKKFIPVSSVILIFTL